jgi:hypothetical protein
MDQSIPYLPPGQGDGIEDDRREEGPFVVVRRGARLLDRCLCCEGPAAGGSLVRKVSWLPFYWYFSILFGVFPFVFAEIFMTRRSSFRYVLCNEHRAWRRAIRLRCWLVVLFGAACLLYSFVSESATLFFIGLGLLVALEAFLFIASRRLVHRIDDRFVWLRRNHLGYIFVNIFSYINL